MGWEEKFEEELLKLTEEDAGFKNERDYRRRRNYPKDLTLDEYKDLLRFNERDYQQMISMGR